MRFQNCFTLAPLMALLAVGSDAGAQVTCQQEEDFSQIEQSCPVTVTQGMCAGLIRDNQADWMIDSSLPVCLGRSETLPTTGYFAHARQCNRYFTDKHGSCHNRMMMMCAYRGMFGHGVIWLDDDPGEIYRNHQIRKFAYAEVVFMKNLLCRLPERNKLYLHR